MGGPPDIARSPVTLCPDIRQERRLRVPHGCELPSHRVLGSLRRPIRFLPRTSSLLPTTRQHFQNRHFRRWTSPADLPTAIPKTPGGTRRNLAVGARSDSSC